ncbi:MAG: Maf family protein [Phycisphaerae bacterium]|nr:Maf family protein [Phycisphaerae bacterium]
MAAVTPDVAPALPTVFLASRSPRRREMLGRLGIRFEVVESGIDDGPMRPGRVGPQAWVAALAYLKARAARAFMHERAMLLGEPVPPGVILGADTIVWKDGLVIGQPVDAPDAHRIIRALESGAHEVHTGVALLDTRTERRELIADSAHVRVGPLGEERISTYVRSGGWAGKAGGYNLSERLAAGWPIQFEGDPGTIMGLPLIRLPRALERFVRPNGDDRTA